MPVQDDERERELVRMFNLKWDPAHQRGGCDALLDLEHAGRPYRFEVEVKSTTNVTVSTARDVGMEHIAKWRRKLFIIGFYSRDARRPELQKSLCLTPIDMEPWIGSIESKISIDYQIARRAARRLELQDVHEVCGERSWYSIQDAKRVHKQQWSAQEYDAALDMEADGHRVMSPARMLEVLRLRSQYIAERGATLNNPHITRSHLAPFFGSDREIAASQSAEGIRRLARDFITSNPNHAAVLEGQRLAASQ